MKKPKLDYFAGCGLKIGQSVPSCAAASFSAAGMDQAGQGSRNDPAENITRERDLQ